MRRTMAEGSDHKQDFAPPWLKFPPADSSKKSISHPADRNRPRREDPYSARMDFRLHRQSSFDFHEGKRFHQGPPKFRHHSVDDDYYMSPYNYGYYPPAYYDNIGMHYSSQPALGRPMGRDGRLFPPRPSQGGPRRGGGYYDKDYYRDARNYDGKHRGDRERPFADDFPSLVSNGEPKETKKPSKPGSGVWENPPKSNRNEDSSDLLKNSSSGIYKALVPNKTGSSKKSITKESVRMNGNLRDSSPLSPSNKANKEGTRQSPTTDLSIISQPKKLGDKKSEFLKTLRNESSNRNGENCQDQNQNAVGKKQLRLENGNPLMEDETLVNGIIGSETVNGKDSPSFEESGEALISDVDHINLQGEEGEEEEKRLLLAMGWDEEDDTEYVITEDEIKEFQNLLQNHCHGQKNGLKSTFRNILNKTIANGLNGSNEVAEKQSKPL